MSWNNRGQATIGIVTVVAVISFILMMNLQSQAEIVQRKIIATKAQSEAESAINEFAMQLYSAYVQAAEIKESLTGTLRYKGSAPDNVKHRTFEFYIENSGKKLCISRARNGADVDICISLPNNLPNDFARNHESNYNDPTITKTHNSFFTKIIKQAYSFATAEAQRVQTSPFSPNINAVVPNMVVDRLTAGTIETDFSEHYEQQNCEAPHLVKDCVKIKICLKFGGCANDAEKVSQTYVFLYVPKTQLRD